MMYTNTQISERNVWATEATKNVVFVVSAMPNRERENKWGEVAAPQLFKQSGQLNM
jgi:hypothetical protein